MISFTNGSCYGANTGKNLTSASNFLILAGGGNGQDTCSSCSGVIDILSGNVTSTLSATATNSINIENIIRISGTGTPTTATSILHGSTVQFPDIANAAETDILCYNTTGGTISYETTVGGCVPSDPRLKIKGPDLSGDVALASLDQLEPGSGVFRPETHLGDTQQVWLYADQVCTMDERLCVRDKSGFLNYDKVGMLAYLVAAVKQQQIEISNLRQRLQ